MALNAFWFARRWDLVVENPVIPNFYGTRPAELAPPPVIRSGAELYGLIDSEVRATMSDLLTEICEDVGKRIVEEQVPDSNGETALVEYSYNKPVYISKQIQWRWSYWKHPMLSIKGWFRSKQEKREVHNIVYDVNVFPYQDEPDIIYDSKQTYQRKNLRQRDTMVNQIVCDVKCRFGAVPKGDNATRIAVREYAVKMMKDRNHRSAHIIRDLPIIMTMVYIPSFDDLHYQDLHNNPWLVALRKDYRTADLQ
jgi:hypothetical protein